MYLSVYKRVFNSLIFFKIKNNLALLYYQKKCHAVSLLSDRNGEGIVEGREPGLDFVRGENT